MRRAWSLSCCMLLLFAAASVAAEPSPTSDDAQSDAPAASAHPTHADPSPTSAARLRAALARYRREPSVAAVVRVARASMAVSPTTTMASRARTAGWVPTLGLSARRGQGVDLSSPSQSAAGDPLRLSTDDELSLTASLRFELDRLVFRHEEIPIVREARAERAAHGAQIREVVRVYFLRRRLQLERDLGVGDATEQALGIAEAEALLDVFTNGAFGRMLTASGRRR